MSIDGRATRLFGAWEGNGVGLTLWRRLIVLFCCLQVEWFGGEKGWHCGDGWGWNGAEGGCGWCGGKKERRKRRVSDTMYSVEEKKEITG